MSNTVDLLLIVPASEVTVLATVIRIELRTVKFDVVGPPGNGREVYYTPEPEVEADPTASTSGTS